MIRWLIIALVLAFGAGAQERAGRASIAGQFDYYLLALSWSPSYCAVPEVAAREPAQCGRDRRFSFVVHGLWPQYERGWPADCPTRQPANVPPALAQKQLDIMPSARLVENQWDKHGACSGLTQEAYFDLARRLRTRIIVPAMYQSLEKPLLVTGAEVEAQFVRANPGLTPQMIAVSCDQRRLREVRICFTKDGRLRACGSDVRDRCEGRVAMPPIRAAR